MRNWHLAFVILLIPQLIFALRIQIDTSENFSDVLDYNENYEAINYVKSNNIVSGYEDGTFKPKATINRAELTKIIMGSKFSKEEINECNLLSLSFTDVPTNTWFAPFVCLAKEKNIIEGYDDNSFKPSQNVTFVEASKIVASIFAQNLPDTTSNTWFTPFVTYLSDQNAIPHSIDDLGTKVTRADIAEIIFRLHSNNTQKPSLKFINGKLVKESIAEVQEVPENCQHWYDGCNDCYRSDIGASLKCTKKSCQSKEIAECKFFFPTPIIKPNQPTSNCKSWTDSVNTCSQETTESQSICTDNQTNKKPEELIITCLIEFEDTSIPAIIEKNPPIYTLVSPANIEESVGNKAIALYFHSFEDCAFCNGIDKDISTQLDQFPINSVILKVQFDTDLYKELKDKWEITEPNTVVVINKEKVTTFKKTDFTIKELKEALKKASK